MEQVTNTAVTVRTSRQTLSLQVSATGIYTITVKNVTGCISQQKGTILPIPVLQKIACPADTTVECLDDVPVRFTSFKALKDAVKLKYNENDFDPTSFESFEQPTDETALPIHFTYFYTITNRCGVEESCNQMITVEDTQKPVLICPETPPTECLSAIPDATNLAGFLMAGGHTSDNCLLDSSSSPGC